MGRRWDGREAVDPYNGDVLSSFVLRLVPRALAAGEVTGEIVEVETGRQAVIRNISELAAFLTGAGAALDWQEHS